MHIVEADSIRKVYKGRTSRSPEIVALDTLSLRVSEGEIYGLLGPNGAGKTTFIKVLLEIVFPTAGSATMFGHPLNDVRARASVGYLPENHRFPEYLTGEQVLRFYGRLSGVDDNVLDKRIPDLLALVGMSKWNRTRIRKYSKGMMQRLGLAQALVNDPGLVILDEPTDGVDPIGRKEIRSMLQELRSRGKTVFLNSHLLSEVEMVCDRVAILNHGRLIREGTVKELTTLHDEYIITHEGGIPDALRIEWEARRLHARSEGGALHLNLRDTAELNSVVDQLRSHGVLISGILVQRSTLEDMFIKAVQEDAA